MTIRNYIVLLAGCLALGCRPAVGPEELPKGVLDPGADAPQDAPLVAEKDGTRKLALLVGCSRYEQPLRSLRGPANDVILVRQLLQERFGFQDANIITLAEGAAAGRPTRANIQARFAWLAQTAAAGDQIMILLGGHGAQQPEAVAGDESDGLDETFLPCDARPWDAAKKTIVNAITDNELGVWVKAITDRGAAVWLVLDSCHSGTMLRGDSEVAREAAPGQLVPDDVLRQARAQAGKRGKPNHDRSVPPLARLAENNPRLFALYACQAHEPTLDRPMPPDGDGETWHGLLTYTLCQVLKQAVTPLTYRELTQRIYQQYVRWGKLSPIPLCDGPDEEREVLGVRSLPGRSPFILRRADNGWLVSGGQLHGLNVGSVLAVQPPAGTAGADQIVGHVRVQTSRLAEVEVVPCAFANLPAVAELPVGGSCKPVQFAVGSLRLRVGVEPAEASNADTVRRVCGQLQQLAGADDALIESVEPDRSEVLVRVDGDKLYLLLTESSRRVGALPPGTPRFGPFSSSQAKQLGENLTRIARARNLLRLASESATGKAAEVNVEMRQFKNENDVIGQERRWGPHGFVLRPGDWVGWRISQGSGGPMDISVLFINSEFKIQAIFPKPAAARSGENRFTTKGQGVVLGPFPVLDRTIGLEHLVVIAVPGQGQPIDFSWLAQPSLGTAERSAGPRALASPLGRLLKSAMYGAGASRGLDLAEVDAQAIRVMSWTVLPAQKRP